MAQKKGTWLALGGTVNFSRNRVATLAEVTAGPILQATFKWTGSSIMPLTVTLR